MLTPVARAGDAEAGVEHFAIRREVASNRPEAPGVMLVLHSAKVDAETLELRVGIENRTRGEAAGFGVVLPEDFRLVSGGSDSPSTLKAKRISSSLYTLIPSTGLPPGLANAGSLTFATPEKREQLELRVPHFPPLTFTLDANRRFTPADIPRGKPVPVNQTLSSHLQGLDLLRLRVRSVERGESFLDFHLSLTNSSSRALMLKAAIPGDKARLITSENSALAPVAPKGGEIPSLVSPGPWPSGDRRPARIRFPLPHPHAATRLFFLLPGYPPLQLRAGSEGEWVTEVLTPDGAPPGPSPLLRADRLYKSLQARVGALNAGIKSTRPEAALDALEEPARGHIRRLLASIGGAPVAGLQFALSPSQDFPDKPDRWLKDVQAHLSYSISPLGPTGRFRSPCLLAFRESKPGAGDWRLGDCRFQAPVPFWTLGYTESESSDHFLVFAKRDSKSSDKLKKSLRQLEKAYRKLTAEGLPLGSRYPAFFVDSPKDMERLAGPGRRDVLGVATSSTAPGGSAPGALNRAMFINDATFLSQENLIGMSDRQKTITHELVHLATATHNAGTTPIWLTEGLAVHLAKQIDSFTRQDLRDGGALRTFRLSRMSTPGAFNQLARDRKTVGRLYAYSGEAVAHLVRQHGLAKVLAFHKAFAFPPRHTPPPARPRGEPISLTLTKRLLLDHFGTGIDDLDAALKSHLLKKTL